MLSVDNYETGALIASLRAVCALIAIWYIIAFMCVDECAAHLILWMNSSLFKIHCAVNYQLIAKIGVSLCASCTISLPVQLNLGGFRGC